MKALAGIAVVSLAVGAAFVVGMFVGRNSSDGTGTLVWTGTSDTPSVLTEYDNRPVVFVADGGTGTIDDWEVTASFRETTAPYGYGKRRVDFDVLIEWTGEDRPGEMMRYSFLEGAMMFVSPSGKTADVQLGGDYPSKRYEEVKASFEGSAANESNSLPDEAGTFFLVFAPHPYKYRLVWSVDLAYQS